jgi:hypothetical protein
MNKIVKIAIIAAAALAVIAGGLFIVAPLVTSKEAEARLSEVFTEAGIPEEMWSVDRAYYIPLLGHLVIEKLEFGETGSDEFLTAKKITLAIDTAREDFFAGSVDAQELSVSAEDIGLTIKSLSVNDFSVDGAPLAYSPVEAIKKLGNINVSDVVVKKDGETCFSLERLNIDADYAEGKIPLSSSVSLKELVMDIRQVVPLPALRPEYRLSNLTAKNSFSGGLYSFNLDMEGTKLFTLKLDFGVSLPRELLESGETTELALMGLMGYGEDIKINSFKLTYTDKSLLDHLFELSGIPGGKESAVEELNESLMTLAMMSGVDAERFVSEVMKFIEKPGKFELKTNIASPVSLAELEGNPLAMNLSLSINGGKPFTLGE